MRPRRSADTQLNALVDGMQMVRETGDHGPINSWDRQPYFTLNGVHDGFNQSLKPPGQPGASLIKQLDFIKHNFLINGYNSVWTIDHGTSPCNAVL